jgi:uncharacterized protein
MSKKIDICENDLNTLALFSNGYDREYHIREICCYLPISHGTAQTILSRLEEKKVLVSSQRGKTRVFRIKNGEIAIQYFILAELYKKICFMEQNPYISEILNKIYPYAGEITLLFGSYAKGTEDKDSDIDIFVAGICDEREIAKVGRMYDMEINLKQYPAPAFTASKQQDPLLIEIRKNHIVWKNAESFVREVLA